MIRLNRLTIVSLLFVRLSAQAQEKPIPPKPSPPPADKGYFAVSIGQAIPMGDFADVSLDNEKSGFANPGLIANVSYMHKVSQHFGGTAMFHVQSNGVNGDELVHGIQKALPGVIVTSDVGAYKLAGFLCGLYAGFESTSKIDVEAKAMIGYMSATAPEMYVHYRQGGTVFWTRQLPVNASAISYLLSLGAKFNAGKKIAILFSADYMIVQPEFKNAVVELSTNQVDVFDFKQQMNSIIVRAGLGFRF